MESPSARTFQRDAAAEGRRIYLGNLVYEAKPQEIEDALAASSFTDLEKIHISVDAVSGRNPGYCFVDFRDKDTADRALSSLNATIRDRTVKVGPCEPKKYGNSNGNGQRREGQTRGSEATGERWGNWRPRNGEEQQPRTGGDKAPYAALEHFNGMVADETDAEPGRKLFVGGLGRMSDQAEHQEEIMQLFAGFTPAEIGKRITAKESQWTKPGNHNFCFVHFDTVEQASEAAAAVNGRQLNGEPVKVSVARRMPERLTRQPGQENGAAREGSPRNRNYANGSSAPRDRAVVSSDWRRKAA